MQGSRTINCPCIPLLKANRLTKVERTKPDDLKRALTGGKSGKTIPLSLCGDLPYPYAHRSIISTYQGAKAGGGRAEWSRVAELDTSSFYFWTRAMRHQFLCHFMRRCSACNLRRTWQICKVTGSTSCRLHGQDARSRLKEVGTACSALNSTAQ